MPGHFVPETSIFESIDLSNATIPRHCGLCNQNPPAFAYRFGEFTDGNRAGHCCTPCACRQLVEMAERAQSKHW